MLFQNSKSNANNDWCYKVLNIHPNATKKEIKFAYKKMILKYHPDKNKNISPDEFVKIKNAYDTLLENNEEYQIENDFSSSGVEKDVFMKELHELISTFDIQKIKNKLGEILISSDIDKIIILLLSDREKLHNILSSEKNIIKYISDININLTYTIKELWDCVKKNIYVNRLSINNSSNSNTNAFIEEIYPIDFVQIYAGEGQTIKFKENITSGDIIVNIQISTYDYAGEKYYVYENDLYILINRTRISNNKFTINFLDDRIYKFNLSKLCTLTNNLGKIFKKRNFGFIKSYGVEEISFRRGDLFFMIF